MSYAVTNPFLNQPQANSLREPRAIVTINGIQAKWIEIEVVTNHFYVSDTFRITMPLTGQPAELNLQYWAVCGLFEVKIYIGFPADPNNYSTQNLPLFMTGDISDFSINPVTGMVIINGRDLSLRLIDKKLTRQFTQYTLSQIAELFAAENNLTVNVEPTTQPVGIFYKNEYVILSNNSTEWDLLVGLAQLQNFVVWVTNNTLTCVSRQSAQHAHDPYVLNFQPPANANLVSQVIQDSDIQTSLNVTDGVLYPRFNGMSLNLARTPYSDISVTVVVPYSSFSKKFFAVTVTSSNRRSGDLGLPSAPPRKFVHKFFGLSNSQAKVKAQQLLNSYLMHEFELNAELPGDNTLQKDSLIKLTGTNTDFDQLYYPDEVTRRISLEEGYTMTVNAKSQSSQTEIN